MYMSIIFRIEHYSFIIVILLKNMATDDSPIEIMANILDRCKNGCTKDKIMQETRLSHDQLRRITIEMVDRELLYYIEARDIYITTDNGYILLNRRQQPNTLQNNSKVFDKKSEKKAEGLLLNSIASKRNITHRKIQLWTNKHQNEFAIKLTPDSDLLTTFNDDSNIFLAATNPNEDYVRVVAETDYFEPLKHGWEYTLRHLIEQYKQEIRTISLRKIAPTNKKVNNKLGKENNNKTISIRLIPYNKCRYCDSEFNTEEQKNEHELERHI
jgi:predicted transcriptional regulator